jgi:hypothetical protein
MNTLRDFPIPFSQVSAAESPSPGILHLRAEVVRGAAGSVVRLRHDPGAGEQAPEDLSGVEHVRQSLVGIRKGPILSLNGHEPAYEPANKFAFAIPQQSRHEVSRDFRIAPVERGINNDPAVWALVPPDPVESTGRTRGGL